MLAALGLTLTVVDPGTASAADNGDALLTIYEDLPHSYEYGQDQVFHGSAQDLSLSCLGPAFDCDSPEGYVYIHVEDDTAEGKYVAVADLSPYDGGSGDLSFWGPMTLRGAQLLPGTYTAYFGMESTFRPTGYSFTMTVRKIACSVALTQTSPTSNPNDQVTFTASIAGNGDHSGQMIFTDQDGGLLANPTIVGGSASFTTGALPQGTTTVTATWSGGNPVIYDGCASSVSHTVSSDPNPVAVDDTYHVDAGASITVNPLRAEYLDTPDLGEIESLNSNGTSLKYTAPADVVTLDQVHYIAYDGIGQGSNEATITFVVGCEPEAHDDTYAVTYGTSLTVEAPGVFQNDAGCDLPTELKTQPSHGTLSYDGQSGGFTYTPAAGYSGPDSFTYRYSQGLDNPIDASVRLQVGQPITPTSTTTSTTSTSTSTTSTSTTSTSTTSTTAAPSTTSTTTVTGPPTITSVSPESGGPGTPVTVTGTDFVPGQTTVTVGGAEVEATVADADARAIPGTLTFVVPDGAQLGTGPLTVTTPFGAATAQDAFTVLPAVTATTAGPPTTATSAVATSAPPSGTAGTGTGTVSSGTLPRTGSSGSQCLAGIGISLLAAGLGVLGLRRRATERARPAATR